MFNHTSAGATVVIWEKETEEMPMGAEVKVKIAADPKAPKVSIDYVKGIISFPKGVEYYTSNDEDGNPLFSMITETTSKAWKATLADLTKYGVPTEGGVVFLVRSAATETKVASNVTPVIIPTVKIARLSDDSTENEGTVTVSGSTATVTYKGAGTETKPTYQFTANGASFDFSLDGGAYKTVKSGNSLYSS